MNTKPTNKHELAASVERLRKVWADKGWPFKDETQCPIGFELLACPLNAKPSIPPPSAGCLPAYTLVAQTLWTRPYGDVMQASNLMQWGSRLAALCSLVLSARLLRQAYPNERLVMQTDYTGLALLRSLGIDGVYSSIQTSLLWTVSSALSDEQARHWWVIGKLASMAHTLSSRPMLHVDLDCFLFKPLRFPSGSYCMAQNREPIWGDSLLSLFYQECLLEALGEWRNNWLDPDGLFSRLLDLDYASNFGFFFGSEPFLPIVTAMEESQRLCATPDFRMRHFCRNMLLEQYLVSSAAKAAGIELRSLLADPTNDEAKPSAPADLGYCHAVADAKKNPNVCRMICDMVKQAFPEQYERAVVLSW